MQPLLKFNPPPYSVEAQTQLPPVSLKAVFAFLRRNWLVLIASAVLGIVAGVVYLENAQPVYVARTELVVDTRENTALPLQRTTETVANDASSIETQVGLLASENVLMSAIDNEKLLEDPIFTGANDKADTIPIWLANAVDAVMSSGPIQAITGMFGPIKVDDVISRDSPARNDAEFRRKRLAVERLRANLSVERRGLTNIIEIRYSSNDSRLPARIANAITQAYISDQLNVKFQTSKIATDWLQTRIAELREQNAAASRAVQDFRTRNNLIETSRGRISEQQLGEFNSQLVLARVATSESKARLDRIVEVAASGVPDPTTTEVIKSEIITRLRNQYLDLSQREREIANRLGEDHPVASDIRKQMSEVRRAMAEELSRLIASARS